MSNEQNCTLISTHSDVWSCETNAEEVTIWYRTYFVQLSVNSFLYPFSGYSFWRFSDENLGMSMLQWSLNPFELLSTTEAISSWVKRSEQLGSDETIRNAPTWDYPIRLKPLITRELLCTMQIWEENRDHGCHLFYESAILNYLSESLENGGWFRHSSRTADQYWISYMVNPPTLHQGHTCVHLHLQQAEWDFSWNLQSWQQ